MGQARARSIGIAAVVAAALALAGCAGARADFAREFRGDDAISGLELTTGDNMPFTKGVRATVRVADGVDEAGVTELAARLGAFFREHPDEPVAITVQTDRFSVPVFADDAVTHTAIREASLIAAEPGVDSVELIGDLDAGEITAVSIRVSPDVGAAFALARSVQGRLDGLAAPGGAYLAVEDAGSAIRIGGAPGHWLEDAEASWALVDRTFPVTGVHADAEGVVLRLANEPDVPRAQELIRVVDPPLQTPVMFESPLIRLGLNGTGNEVRVMLEELDDRARSLILFVWTNATEAEFRVADERDIPILEEALAEIPEESLGGLSVSVAVEPR